MKVLAIMGSHRKGQTEKIVNMFEKHLKSLGEVDFEYVFLKDMDIQTCVGCANCLEKGEEFCPLKDDRDRLYKKLLESDGVIFASPNYSLQVSALLKNLFDRLAFVFHRPCFFHKASIGIITQGVYGAKDIIKYINTVCDFWGFNVCPGVAVTTPWGVSNPKQEGSDAERVKIHLEVKKGAERFYQVLIGPRAPEPSYKKLLIFRFVRSAHKYSTERKRDYQHFSEQGWLEKPYFYETKLSWPKRLLGTLIDKWQAK